jgi:hypothetical protein
MRHNHLINLTIGEKHSCVVGELLHKIERPGGCNRSVSLERNPCMIEKYHTTAHNAIIEHISINTSLEVRRED